MIHARHRPSRTSGTGDVGTPAPGSGSPESAAMGQTLDPLTRIPRRSGNGRKGVVVWRTKFPQSNLRRSGAQDELCHASDVCAGHVVDTRFVRVVGANEHTDSGCRQHRDVITCVTDGRGLGRYQLAVA